MQEQATAQEREEIIYRKWDTDDVVRLRDFSLAASPGKLKELSMRAGTYQKISVVLGVKKAPWFSDVIDDNVGVTDEVFERRKDFEFKKLPIDKLDELFVEVQKINGTNVDLEDLRKKLQPS